MTRERRIFIRHDEKCWKAAGQCFFFGIEDEAACLDRRWSGTIFGRLMTGLRKSCLLTAIKATLRKVGSPREGKATTSFAIFTFLRELEGESNAKPTENAWFPRNDLFLHEKRKNGHPTIAVIPFVKFQPKYLGCTRSVVHSKSCNCKTYSYNQYLLY